MMDASKIVNEQLKIPIKYLKNFIRPDRVEGIVHRSWLRHLLQHSRVPQEFTLHEQLSPAEVEAWFKQGENFGSNWQKLLFMVVRKHDGPVIPLPRANPRSKADSELSYCQALHYVSHTNHKNLWKDVFKKYSNSWVPSRHQDQSTIQLTESGMVLRDVIHRAYGCPVVTLSGGGVGTGTGANTESREAPHPHPNLLPCVVALEAESYFILVFDNVTGHTLEDCVTFSPAALTSHSRPLFLLYQLLCVLRHVHGQGLLLGGLTLADIHIDQHFWIQVIPKLDANLFELPRKCRRESTAAVSSPEETQDLSSLTLAWVRGALSNLEYLTELNKLAGRRFGDPRCHHVLPWVTDFSSPNGANWRDLSKSKFRLNKGDRQLDLTYELPPSANTAQVPHHISDVLSEITYYVYLSRVTPRSVLCRYVRPQWVPAEYPSSIQRLQQWTPDECIPEFFTDPSVFKSIHPDLPDLELPAWAASAEQLVAHHRATLESDHVSDRLHHWIDLTFGYKLSGPAAVKSKNVCLQLVDAHTGLTDCGVVQLFPNPHPQRATPSPYWGLTPPHVHHRDHRRAVVNSDEEDGPSSGGEESVSVSVANTTPHSSPLALTRLLSRSRASLQPAGNSGGGGDGKQGTISLPHDYNPVALLNAVESLHAFTGGTSGGASGISQATHCKQVVAARRHEEMQVLGCLIVELFLPSKLRLTEQSPQFPQRLSICRSVLAANRDAVPRFARSLVTQLLDDSGNDSPITSLGTPSPSAHQLLLPSLSSGLLPLPPSLPTVYSLFTSAREHAAAVTVLQRLQETRPDYEEPLTACIDRLGEWKVQSVAKHLSQLVEQPQFNVELVLSLVLELLNDPDTTVSAAWHLFDPIAKLLGPVESARTLLQPMVRLYDCDSSLTTATPRQLKKRIKLYHRSFLLRLIVRFRLRTFLDHFVTPLVEAVGGCHDVDTSTLPVDNTDETEDTTECVSALSPLDEDSSADSEKTPVPSTREEIPTVAVETEEEPEVFVLETEDSVDAAAEDQSQQIASLLLDLQTDDVDDTETPTRETEPLEVPAEQWPASDVESTASTDDQHRPTTEYNKVSEVGVASMLWLSHRLGPVLTATRLSRNLLRMLSLCYAAQGCVRPRLGSAEMAGDENAASVLQCLSAIVELYGEQFIVVQYLPATADVISLARKKLTGSLEAGVVAHLALLSTCLPLLSDNTLHQLFQEVILAKVCGPALRLASSTRQLFPGGVAARRAVVLKLVHCLHALMLRATTEQKITLVHSITRLFLVFSKARGQPEDNRGDDPVSKVRDYDSTGSFSPPQSNTADGDSLKCKALEELAAVMSAELAHFAYTPFASFFGEPLMEQSLKNFSLIKELCTDHQLSCDNSLLTGGSLSTEQGDSDVEDSVGSFGTNVIVIGNRIDLQEPIGKSASPNAMPVSNEDSSDQASKLIDSNSRHLRGNWLGYWQHAVGSGHALAHLDVKQVRLLGFSGHTNSVRSLAVLDNENSFLSGSRDKTVKVWALRSMGDGGTVCPAQWTYTGHRKSVLSVGFCEAARLAVSCDSAVHLWDPYVGRVLATTDTTRTPPVNTLRPLPSPSQQVLAATTEPSLRTLDTRVGGYVNELKVPSSSAGLVRCIAVAPSGRWVALGQAGHLTTLDLRTGTVLAAWRGHDNEVLQLVATSDHSLVSSSLDQAVSVWNPHDGKLKFNMKGPTEPVHCLDLFCSELVSGTTANRIGVHSALDPASAFSTTRLRSDGFRGVLTTLQVLPLNRLLLLGADTGSITLIC